MTVNAAVNKLPKRKTPAPKPKPSKSKAGLVMVLYDDLDDVRHQAKFYNRKTYPNILYFHLWDQNTFELQRMGWCRYDVLYSVLGAKAKTIQRSRVSVCQSSARFMSLSIHGTIPAPEIVPQQVIEGGLSGVIRVLEQAWPTARKILVSNLKTAPEGWELLNEEAR